MRDSPRSTPAKPAAHSSAPAASVADGGMSAMQLLASAAYISEPRLARGSKGGSATRGPSAGRADPVAPTAAAPPLERPTLERPTVSGAAGGHAGDHVGGAMRPPTRDTVALSDGTRISFGAVAEVADFELA